MRITEKLFEAGVDMVAIADTVGYAGPKQVGELTAGAVKIARPQADLHPPARCPRHGHCDASARSTPARVLDGSLGGLGGCPFAPGATGNVVFEDLAFLCESKGFKTGIDIEKLVAVRAILKAEMPEEALYGGMARAGLRRAVRRRRKAASALCSLSRLRGGLGWRCLHIPAVSTRREPPPAPLFERVGLPASGRGEASQQLRLAKTICDCPPHKGEGPIGC